MHENVKKNVKIRETIDSSNFVIFKVCKDLVEQNLYFKA